jgi:hypothetical protein
MRFLPRPNSAGMPLVSFTPTPFGPRKRSHWPNNTLRVPTVTRARMTCRIKWNHYGLFRLLRHLAEHCDAGKGDERAAWLASSVEWTATPSGRTGTLVLTDLPWIGAKYRRERMNIRPRSRSCTLVRTRFALSFKRSRVDFQAMIP